MNTTPPPDTGSPTPSTEDAAVSARRQAILRGLGKGGAALAALSPVVSHATRDFKLKNDALPAPGFGYCTVSGFQSAAMSGSPAPAVCGALEPKDFIEPLTSLDYDALVGTHASGVTGSPKKKLAAALNSYFGAGANLTEDEVGRTLLNNPPAKLLINATSKKAVIVPGVLGGAASRTSGTELRSTTNFPSDINPTGAFNSLFSTSAETRTLLEVLQDGVASAAPASANSYVLAAYLSVAAPGSSLPPSLNRGYIQRQYTASSYGPASNLYKFFQALCIG
ncbi:hypothetical protein [Pseudaquabacterium pictum]|uniref:Uncharacterized protein n=1 Tax=Pseudaquabacterium pictum TaxID=2315236 RepID=A0A480AVD1_9BURK|nr:hypothetical protein [Rubrivivax pictus]GCL64870.1 hypothetical protein AQPW35_39510 [Rubrivivax pictus]